MMKNIVFVHVMRLTFYLFVLKYISPTKFMT